MSLLSALSCRVSAAAAAYLQVLLQHEMKALPQTQTVFGLYSFCCALTAPVINFLWCAMSLYLALNRSLSPFFAAEKHCIYIQIEYKYLRFFRAEFILATICLD